MRASAIANQELIASVSSDDSTPASGMAHHAVWLVLELLLWSFEGQGAEFADMILEKEIGEMTFLDYDSVYIYIYTVHSCDFLKESDGPPSSLVEFEPFCKFTVKEAVQTPNPWTMRNHRPCQHMPA